MKTRTTRYVRALWIGEGTPALTTDTPSLAAAYWREHIEKHPFFDPMKECLAVIMLDAKLNAFAWHMVSLGVLNETMLHPREVFRPAIAAAAYRIVVMHNHPSGDPSPSDADQRTTRKLNEGGKLLGIEVLDHVIVGYPHYFSFREANLL